MVDNDKLIEMTAEVEAMREDIECSMKESDCPNWARPLHEAGDWLAWKMEQHGASKKEQDDVTFAMGQRIRMRGLNQSYHVAIECYERWLSGKTDKPGFELGNAMIDGEVSP